MAHGFLKEAFQCCGYDDSFTELLATSITNRMNLIQENMITGSLDYAEIWRLFDSDVNIEEVFYCNE
jgi:hypothetical protein